MSVYCPQTGLDWLHDDKEKLELDIKEVKTDVTQDYCLRRKETSVENWA